MDVGSVIWVLILSSAAVLIFLSNLCIFIAVYKSRKLRNRGNIYILCLASSDFLVSVFNVPFTAVSVVYPGLRETGSTLCDISGFFEMTFLIASVFSVTAINVHRYIYVVFWTKYREILRKDRIYTSLSCIWLSATILSAPPLLNLSKIAYKSGKSHCFVDWKVTPGYTFALIIICFLMPIIVMAFCYFKIYTFRQKSRKIVKNRLSKREQMDDRTELALEERGSSKNSSERNEARKNEYDAATNSISNFLNEPINKPGEHVQVEMLDLTKKTSKILLHEGVDEHLDNSYEESCTKCGDRYEDQRSRVEDQRSHVEDQRSHVEDQRFKRKALTEVKFDAAIGKNPKHLLPKRRRRSKMLSWTPAEQTLDEMSVSVPKRSDMLTTDSGQIYQGARDKYHVPLGSRKIEILVEESVSSTTESHTPGNTDYGFQICETAVTESREVYVVQRTNRKSKDDLRLTMMCVIIVAAFFISWFPFVVTMLIESFTTVEIPTAIDRATLLIGYLNSLSNPIIYCYFNKNFRSQLKRIICKRRMRKTTYYGRR